MPRSYFEVPRAKSPSKARFANTLEPRRSFELRTVGPSTARAQASSAASPEAGPAQRLQGLKACWSCRAGLWNSQAEHLGRTFRQKIWQRCVLSVVAASSCRRRVVVASSSRRRRRFVAWSSSPRRLIAIKARCDILLPGILPPA